MIIFLNGPINAGKSTIAKLLTKELPNTALVEIDGLRDMIEWMSIDQAIPINLENAVSVIKNFSNRKLDVIIPYPLSQENYDYVISGLKDLNTKIYVFTLAPKLEKTLTNRGTRELSDWERERIKYHYNTGIAKPSFGEIIDNSEQTPEETAEYILTRICGKVPNR
jgi:adenylate kinase family enzyme